MTSRPRPLCLALCGVAFLLLHVRTANAVDAAPVYPWQEEVWRLAADLRVDDALTHLPARRQAGSDAERRQIDHARAVLLLEGQPRLQGNIDQARVLFEGVRQSRADDDSGLGALYHLARIAQFHAEPRDPAHAASQYDELIAHAPDLPLAQEAVSRLAGTDGQGKADERAARFSELDELQTQEEIAVAGRRRKLARIGVTMER